MTGKNETTIPRYEVYTHRDTWGGEWSLYNLWDKYYSEEVRINGGGNRGDGYTRDRAYADRVCQEMNNFSDSPKLLWPPEPE